MTSVTEGLSQFEGKRVVVVRTRPGSEVAEEVEGLVASGNELGLLIKPKGKAGVEIIEASEIDQVTLAPEKAKPLTVKWIKEVDETTVRQHLLDRHGATLKEVNEMSDSDAQALHEDIDHNELDLGHRHGEKPKGKRGRPSTSSADGDDSGEDGDDNDDD